MTAPHLLLIGAGDLGTEIGLRYAGRHDAETPGADSRADDPRADDPRTDDADSGRPLVVAIRRRAELVPAPMVRVAGDVAAGLPAHLPAFDGPGGGPRHLVICLTAGGRDAEDYRRTFVDGVHRVLADVTTRGWAPERAVFVSSTSVCAGSGDVDETTPPGPTSDTARVLLEAERLVRAALPEETRGIVVRPSGLYGPGRGWFIEQVRRGAVTDLERMTHRVHRDDVARAVVHLLTMPAEPDDLYLVTDDAPVPAGEVAGFIAARLGLSPEADPGVAEPGKPGEHIPSTAVGATRTAPSNPPARRLHNTRLHETGFSFTYPTYREGYAAILDGEGVRHP